MAGAVGAVTAGLRHGSLSAAVAAMAGRWQRPLAAPAAAALVHMQQQRGIVSKELRDPAYKRLEPYPYRQKTYNLLRAFFDSTLARMDENSKIIVVDGPPTGNKTAFCKQMAAQLDMLYFEPPNLDLIYITDYGYDLRQVNDKMPAIFKSFDIVDFLKKPTHPHTIKMQFHLMHIRFVQYIDAVTHLFATGQGVVMHRSIYSDFVFMEALYQSGFMTKESRKYYNHCIADGMVEFMRPHLAIYLDIPVKQVLKNVAERGRPEEVNSPFFTEPVLERLEKAYKEQYLPLIGKHAEVLVYDWSEGGDVEDVVEDICRMDLDLEHYAPYYHKMQDWEFRDDWEWKRKRIMFSDFRSHMMCWLDVPTMYVPELLASGEDNLIYRNLMDSIPGNQYDYGFNKEMGDKYYFKTKPDIKTEGRLMTMFRC